MNNIMSLPTYALAKKPVINASSISHPEWLEGVMFSAKSSAPRSIMLYVLIGAFPLTSAIWFEGCYLLQGAWRSDSS